MKHPIENLLILLAATALVPCAAHAQSTAFTYQGRLNDGTGPANGTYHLRFALFDALTLGNQIGAPLTNAPVNVSNGMFTVALDFGANYPGADRWLEIGVRTNGGGAFVALNPRQPITATPYALEAASAARLQQFPISTVAPVSGQVLSYSGTQWQPATPPTVPPLAGDLAGTLGAASVVGMRGVSINPVAPTSGQVLTFSGTQWQPAAVPATPPPPLGGDLTGPVGSASVVGLQRVSINPTAPTSGQVLTFSGTQWQPAAVPATPPPPLGGDLTGPLGSALVVGLRGVSINPVAPTSGQVLTFSGTQWQPAAVPAIPSPGSAVTAESFGAPGSVGTATVYARADHIHAMPGLPADLALRSGGNSFTGNQIITSGSLGVGVTSPLHTVHVGNSLGVTAINSAGNKIVVENVSANGRAALLALAGPGSTTAANRVELQFEASDSEHRAILGTSSAHEVELRVNNAEVMTLAANGNVGIGNSSPQQKLHVIGNILASGTITPNSDRNAKTGFAPVDTAAVLEKVAHMSIQQWRFKAETEDVKHIGPMAQDFRAAFGLGEIATAIATVDADGVALAAIQGLNQKLEETRAVNAELKQRLERLEQLISAKNGGTE